ncbi:LPS assembly protein LptD [Sphingomonas sp. MMS24-JH45]
MLLALAAVGLDTDEDGADPASRRTAASRSRRRDRRAGGGDTLAAGGAAFRRHAATDPARAAGGDAGHRQPAHPERGISAPSTWRIRTSSRSTASPATIAGKIPAASPMARTGRSTCPASRSRRRWGRAIASTAAPKEILPVGTGLSDQFSDIVGRTTVRVGDFVSFIHRYRLDKSDLAVRRNEVDATVGSRSTYATVGYLRLNRDIRVLEDLQDREEVRVGGRVAFARFWSVWGSAIVDLTGKDDDPLTTADGFADPPSRWRRL